MTMQKETDGKISKLDAALSYLRTDRSFSVLYERVETGWKDMMRVGIGIAPTYEPEGMTGLYSFEKGMVQALRSRGLQVTENYSQYRENGALDFGAFFFNTTIGKRATTLSISDKNALKLLRVAAQKVLESTDVKLLVGVQVYPTKRIYEEGRGGKINSLQYGEALTLKEIKKYLPTYTKDVELSHHMTKTG